jgi:hypothetical protein
MLILQWIDELFRLASSNIAVNGFDYQHAFRDVEGETLLETSV